MTPTTSEKFSGALRSVYTKELEEEMNTLKRDMDKQMGMYQGSLPLTYPRQSQVRFTGDEVNYPGQYVQMPIHLDMSPSAVKLRKVRQLELEQRVAKMKRGNKPSYRQRQRNARAARG